jgi:hypothetical protein
MTLPFVPTASPVSLTPKVAIEFSGQMMLQPGANDTAENRTCEIGVNRFSPNHILQVFLTIHKPNRPSRTVPLIKGHLTDDFVIRLGPDAHVPPDPAARPGDFRVFAPTADPFVRTAAAGNNDLDYRWALNLRDPQIHPTASRASGAEPIVKLRTGTLFAPELTPEGFHPQLEREGSEPIKLFKIAPELVAAIQPPQGSNVLLEWTDMGTPVHRALPRDGDSADTRYTVSFINEPPANVPPHEELSLYYKVLKAGGNPIPDAHRFQLTFDSAIGSDLIPCLVVVLNP